MPYIKTEIRRRIDDQIENFIQDYRGRIDWSDTGASNYVITRIILGIMKPEDKWTYDSLSDVIKTLECAKMEISRRIMSGYEDLKAFKNGDLQEFI